MPKLIKVLFVLRPVCGGMRRHVLSLLNRLDAFRFRPLVICPSDGAGLEAGMPPDVPVIPLNIRGDLDPFSDLANAWRIAEIAVKNGVDIVHAHGYKAGLLCLWAGVRRARRFSLLCTFHNPLRQKRGAQALFFRSFARMAGRAADHVITVSKALKDDAVNRLGLPDEKVSCVYNGIDLSSFDDPLGRSAGLGVLREELGIGDRSVAIGTVSRLIPQKGIAFFLAAAHRLVGDFPDLRFVIVGDGPDRRRLESLAIAEGLGDKTVFLGFRSDIPQILSLLDIFALPTLEEGFSLSALEAMAAGKPVVASAVGGLPEVVAAETGILVPPGDVAELERAIRVLLLDRAKRLQMGQAGRELAKERFSLGKMIEQHQQIYERLVSKTVSSVGRP